MSFNQRGGVKIYSGTSADLETKLNNFSLDKLFNEYILFLEYFETLPESSFTNSIPGKSYNIESLKNTLVKKLSSIYDIDEMTSIIAKLSEFSLSLKKQDNKNNIDGLIRTFNAIVLKKETNSKLLSIA